MFKKSLGVVICDGWFGFLGKQVMMIHLSLMEHQTSMAIISLYLSQTNTNTKTLSKYICLLPIIQEPMAWQRETKNL